MSIFNKVISKVFGKKSDKDLKKLTPIVDQINSEYIKLENLSEEELKLRFSKMKSNLQKIIENKKNELKDKKFNQDDFDSELQKVEQNYLDEKMVEVFSIVKDVSRRLSGTKFKVMDNDMIWDMVHYDVQLICGFVLHSGKIS